VRDVLARRFRSRHRDWLRERNQEPSDGGSWPLEIALGVPTEDQALKQVDEVRAWAEAWRSWIGAGSVSWVERRWRSLGTQRVPERLSISNPDEVAEWIGETERWGRACGRYGELAARWPRLADGLPRHFDVLADYGDADYRRLIDVLAWIEKNPASGLYPRQLPVTGLDSKWLEKRKGLLADLVGTMLDGSPGEGDLYLQCGLKAPPRLIRLRILDFAMRQRVGGLEDISVPLEQLAALDLTPRNVFIVENLQTGLAFGDLPESVVIMQLGYGVDVLGKVPWVARARCFYWGDLDTHGFAILNRARGHLPDLKSVLMDEGTLRSHKDLWVEEKRQHEAESLPLLTDAEQAVYRAIKGNAWGQNVRLEQERIEWDVAWKALRRAT